MEGGLHPEPMGEERLWIPSFMGDSHLLAWASAFSLRGHQCGLKAKAKFAICISLPGAVIPGALGEESSPFPRPCGRSPSFPLKVWGEQVSFLPHLETSGQTLRREAEPAL